jgi:hypothetical protein
MKVTACAGWIQGQTVSARVSALRRVELVRLRRLARSVETNQKLGIESRERQLMRVNIYVLVSWVKMTDVGQRR